MDKLSMITLLLARAYTDKKTSEVPAVIQYKGVTTTALSDGATTNPITINGSSYTAVNGDTVFYNGVAYTFDGTVWQETVSLAQIITALEELEDQVGDLSALTTTDKDSVVDAINELVTAVGDKVDKVEGKGLSTNDYDDTEKQKNADNATAITAIKDGATIDSFADVETALSAKQDALTFDDTPTDGSNNPVKSNGIYDALALKQNATDNSLDTEAKTIVGAINEHEGDISSLKSGLTNLDNEVNGDATTYPYADVITIEDAVPSNLADCSVKIEPVQDLHGYDKPWVGGAGKNILPVTLDNFKASSTDGTWNDNIYTYRGITFVVNTDDGGNVTSVVANGTSTQEFALIQIAGFKIPAGSYKLTGVTGGGTQTYRIALNGNLIVYDGETSISFAEDTDCYLQLMIRIEGYVASNVIFTPMLRDASITDSTFAPYTNICPISGHTEASVQRDGKNLLDVSTYTPNKYLGASGDEIDAITYAISKFIRVKPSTQYVASGVSSVNGTYMAFYDADKNFLSSMAETADGFAFTTPNNASYVKLSLRNVTLNAPQLEERQTATPYEPYQGKTYTIALGDTIYGGTMDFDSGVMTVTHQYVTKNTSTMNNLEQYPGWTGAGIKQIVGAGIDGVISTCVNVSDVIRANTLTVNDILFFEKNDIGLTQTELIALAIDVEFVVELATPTTIQLTPQQIQLLKGQNTLTASTGQISVTANGVSGAIGAVQEQVNELAGEHRLIAESGTTGTLSAKIDSLYSAYTALTDEEKQRCYLVYGNTFNIRNVSVSNRKFGSVGKLNVGSLFVESVFIQISASGSTMIKLTVDATGNSFDDMSSTENNNKVQLYI